MKGIDPRCWICHAEMEGRPNPGTRRRYCGVECRRRSETLREIRAELALPEPYPSRHHHLQRRLDGMLAEHERWRDANRG